MRQTKAWCSKIYLSWLFNQNKGSVMEHTYAYTDTYFYKYWFLCKIYPDPFRGGDNILVMCETYKYNKQPTETNKRKTCNEVMERAKSSEPWFGIEQVWEIIRIVKEMFWTTIVFRSTLCWTRTVTPSAGPRMVSPGPRVPTTAVSALTRWVIG